MGRDGDYTGGLASHTHTHRERENTLDTQKIHEYNTNTNIYLAEYASRYTIHTDTYNSSRIH